MRRAKTTDPDEWLEQAPNFSRGMAAQVREWFLHWEPDLSESIKWNNLCFSGRKLATGKVRAGPAPVHRTKAAVPRYGRGWQIRFPVPVFQLSPGSLTAVLIPTPPHLFIFPISMEMD